MAQIQGFDADSLRLVVENVLRQLGTTSPQATPAAASPQINPACGCPVGAMPKTGTTSGRKNYGVFQDADQACQAAHQAFLHLRKLGVEGRQKVIEIVKALCVSSAKEWGKFELEETKIGRLDHKIGKLEIVKHVPGVEWLHPFAFSGDYGITLEEYAPYGVVAAILPVTHSVPTLSGNIVNAVAAGNALVFNPHPGGAKSAAMAIRAYNEAITRATGLENLICTIENPSLESFDALCKHELVSLMCITGGPAVVNAAMKSGKRAICAGPGNPPVVVDETADLAKAARDILTGGAFDNNLLCIGEKAVFVVDSVYSKFLAELKAVGAYQLNSQQLETLKKAAFTYRPTDGGCSHPVVNRDLVGRDPAVLAQLAGAGNVGNSELLFAETAADDLFVIEEQMMPMLPIVRMPNFEAAVAAAKTAEHGYRHSAIIHSRDVGRMTYMAREMDTTLFVKNGPCTAGLGLGGEGYLSYSIATTTGEGITTPKTFTRVRRCVMVENLRIV